MKLLETLEIRVQKRLRSTGDVHHVAGMRTKAERILNEAALKKVAVKRNVVGKKTISGKTVGVGK